MTYRSNLHTHSTFSDGKNTPEEMLLRAVELGFVSFGLSDHSDTPFDHSYCMKKTQYEAYRAECRRLKETYADRIEFFCGLEKDQGSQVNAGDFDFVIGSVHYLFGRDGSFYPLDESLDGQKKLIEKEYGGDRMELARRYYDAVAEHALTGSFSILGHFDVINKFGLFDDAGEDYETIARSSLSAALSRVPFVEVNTGAIFRGYRKAPYPASFLMEVIREQGGKLILGGDSHCIAAVDGCFSDAIAFLKEAGVSTLWRLRKGGFEEVSL